METETDGILLGVVEQMFDWDGQYTDEDGDGKYDHPGLPIYRQWVQTASEMILQDDLDDWWHKFDDDVYIKYRTSVLLRAIQGADAGQPMQYDFFHGKSKAGVLRATLRETARNLTERFGSDAWRQPIFWRYFGDVPADELESLGYDPEATDYISGSAVQLGHIPLKIRHNGMPGWTCIMELDADKPWMQSLIPTGGQSWFINAKMKPNPHINDQTLRHRDFDYKTVSMDNAQSLKRVESKKVLEVP
jgi:hypothetical protein